MAAFLDQSLARFKSLNLNFVVCCYLSSITNSGYFKLLFKLLLLQNHDHRFRRHMFRKIFKKYVVDTIFMEGNV
jgi:hypothetical protein